MEKKGFLKRWGAYIAAAVIFIVLGVVYAWPEVIEGKVINAGDGITASCAVQELAQYNQETGDHSWWTGSMFCGMPSYQIGGGEYQSSKLLAPLDAVLHYGHSHTAWIFIIYFICFFILLRSFKVDPWTSIAGAIATGLSSYFVIIIAAGHNGKTSTIALISVVFAAFYLIFNRKKYGLGAILAMIFTAIGHAVHPQMAYYIFMMTGLCWFAELYIHIREKRYKDLAVATLIFAGAVGIGIATNSAGVFANAEYTRETMRGGHSDLVKETDSVNKTDGLDLDYATQWSYGRAETFSLLIPGFMGGASTYDAGTDSDLYKSMVSHGVRAADAKNFCRSTPMYWGEQPFTAGNVYAGAIVCFLFLLGLLVVKGPYKWALMLSTLFSIFLAWGHNWMGLTRLFFNWFPLYNKFRAVSSILIVAEIAMPLLGFLALRDIFAGKVEKKKLRNALLTAGGITGGLCLFFWLFGGMLFDFKSSYETYASQLPGWLYTAILDERAHLLRADAFRSLLLIVAALILMLLWQRNLIKKGVLIAGLGLLILGDLWSVDRRYLNSNNFQRAASYDRIFAKTDYEKQILADPDPHFRVFNLCGNPFSDARTSYYLKSLGGYSAAKLRRYQDLIDVYLSKNHTGVINMLNAKYVIMLGDENRPTAYFNDQAQGNAWFVDRMEIAPDATAEMEALDRLDLTHEAVADASFSEFVSPALSRDPEAIVALTAYNPHGLDYVYSSACDATLVFSEIYYPHGWKATIDGEPQPHFRANYTLRAMNVPAGEHTIHFEFDPDSVRKGDTIAIIFILLMYAITAGIIVMAVRNYRKMRVNAQN